MLPFFQLVGPPTHLTFTICLISLFFFFFKQWRRSWTHYFFFFPRRLLKWSACASRALLTSAELAHQPQPAFRFTSVSLCTLLSLGFVSGKKVLNSPEWYCTLKEAQICSVSGRRASSHHVKEETLSQTCWGKMHTRSSQSGTFLRCPSCFFSLMHTNTAQLGRQQGGGPAFFQCCLSSQCFRICLRGWPRRLPPTGRCHWPEAIGAQPGPQWISLPAKCTREVRSLSMDWAKCTGSAAWGTDLSVGEASTKPSSSWFLERCWLSGVILNYC